MPETPAAITSMPGDLGTPVLAPLYADGMPLAALGQAVTGIGSTSAPARFWSTPPRPATDTTREALEISLGAARAVNTVSVALPRLPHTTWLQAYDETGAQWVTLADAAGNPAQVSMTDSLPPVVSIGVTAPGRKHPAHYGAGHWVPTVFQFAPTTFSRLRLVQVRVPTGAVPLTPTGAAAPYPLGIRDLVIGYATDTPGGMPLRTGPVAVTSDILGSALTHTLMRDDAWSLPLGRTWRSAPMPTADSVVALYLDCRDALGNTQLFDRLSMDPITSGVSMCVYYASTVPIASTFPASDVPLGTAVVPSATPPAVTGGALVFTGASSYLDIAANAVGFNPAAPFALGLAFSPAYASTDAGPYTLLDAGALTLTYTTGLLTAALGSLRASAAVTFTSGTQLVAGITYDGTTFTLDVVGAPPCSAVGTVDVPWSASIRLGGAQGTAAATSDMSVTALALWQCGTAQAATGLAAFLTSPAQVMALPATPSASHPSDGVVLLVDPTRTSSDSAFGVYGAPGIDTSQVAWTPLARDAIVRAGALQMTPMNAALVKIEFTNLAPMPFETTGGVLTSAPLLDSSRLAVPTAGSNGSPDAGTAVISANGSNQFSDMRRLPAPRPYAVPPTEALYAPDPHVAERVNNQPGYGFAPWQTPASAVAPRGAGMHADAPVQASITARQAYCVALRGIALGRFQNGQAPVDYDRLVDTFGDGGGVQAVSGTGQWGLADGHLLTPTPCAGRRSAASIPYVTHHSVVAAQFASTCSDAQPVLTDQDFTGADFSAWTMLGDATVAIGTGYASAVGHAALLTRHGGSSGGMASAQFFTPGHSGRVYAAVRIYAPSAATAPWQLSLVNGDGTVLATASATPGAGQVVELTCAYNLDGPLNPGTDSWGTYDNAGSWAVIAAHGSYGTLSGTGLWLRNFTVHLTQTGATGDAIYVDSLAMFYDPITWEVSADGGTDWFNVADIRNDPAGVLVFPSGKNGASLMWRASCDAPGVSISAVALRPWYELREGGVRPAPPGVPVGPLLSPSDHYGPIADDPMWQASHRGVPSSWWSPGKPF